jgi:hypothetical protein
VQNAGIEALLPFDWLEADMQNVKEGAGRLTF